MAEHEVTNADDVELYISANGTRRGSSQEQGRIIVDEFTITKEEDNSSVSGVGQRLPTGISRGDIELSFDFTMLGEDVSVFEMVAGSSGESKPFSLTARKTDDAGNIAWEKALETCIAGSEELSASSGDPMEYAVSGLAVGLDSEGTRHDGSSAW